MMLQYNTLLYTEKNLEDLRVWNENKCSSLLSATYSNVSILKIRAPIFSWLNPSLLPNHSNRFDSIIMGHQLLVVNVAFCDLTLRQCLQKS